MNKFLYITLLAITVVGCRSMKDLPEDSPEIIRSKVLKENIANANNQYTSLLVQGIGSYNSQNFRLEVRILHDSIIWIDIADPFLGIKVARAILYQDSVTYINRLQKEYFTGNIRTLQERFNLKFGFETIQNILSANMLFDISDYELYYRPGAYLLSDFNPDPNTDEQGMEKHFGKSVFRQIYIDPLHFKPRQQIQNEPAFGKNYVVSFDSFSPQDGLIYPAKIRIDYTDNEKSTLTIDVNEVESNNSQLNFPFNIPSGYVKMP